MSPFVVFIADLAVIPVALIATVALLYYIPNDKKFQVYARILLAGLSAFLIAKLMATVYQPETARPFELLGVDPGASYLDNPGFPSDHALFVVAITLACIAEVRKAWLSWLLVSLSVLVCIGRVLALVHTPLDVFGGVVAAMFGAIWYLQRPR